MALLKALAKLCAAGTVLLLVLTMALAWALLAPSPAVLRPADAVALAPGQAHQAVSWLRTLALQGLQGLEAPPVVQAPGVVAATPPVEHLPPEALHALAQDLATRAWPQGGLATQVVLLPQRAELSISLPLQALPRLGPRLPEQLPAWLPRWLNLHVSLQQRPEKRLPQLQALQVGRISLPTGPRAQALARWAVQRLGWQARVNQVALALAAVQQVDIQPQGVRLQLLPPWLLGQQLGPLLLPGVPLERLQPYCQRLVQVLRLRAGQAPSAGQGPLALHTVLQPLLAAAASQAAPMAGAAPPPPPSSSALPLPLAQEFQLATLAAVLYATQVPPALLAPGFICPLPAYRTVELAGRHDHALHYLLSALLAQGAHPMLADAVGLYKELADLGDPKGSGFSFDDLAADRAGAEFGLLSRRAPAQLAGRVALMRSDAFLMPSVQGLPSQLSAEQLKAQLGGYGSARFKGWMAEVEHRVRGVPVLGP
ncbi:MAG: hypothetical protein ACK58U_09235 [Rubrivivax sp.]